jgi:hypothetical protein
MSRVLFPAEFMEPGRRTPGVPDVEVTESAQPGRDSGRAEAEPIMRNSLDHNVGVAFENLIAYSGR